MSLTKEEEKTIRLALHYAKEWQDSVIDSYSTADLTFKRQVDEAKTLKAQFSMLLNKLKYTQ